MIKYIRFYWLQPFSFAFGPFIQFRTEKCDCHGRWWELAIEFLCFGVRISNEA